MCVQYSPAAFGNPNIKSLVGTQEMTRETRRQKARQRLGSLPAIHNKERRMNADAPNAAATDAV